MARRTLSHPSLRSQIAALDEPVITTTAPAKARSLEIDDPTAIVALFMLCIVIFALTADGIWLRRELAAYRTTAASALEQARTAQDISQSLIVLEGER